MFHRMICGTLSHQGLSDKFARRFNFLRVDNAGERPNFKRRALRLKQMQPDAPIRDCFVIPANAGIQRLLDSCG